MSNLKRKKKKNALVLCHNGKKYWITQREFWQWIRDKVVTKLSDNPLTGQFIQENAEYTVIIRNTVLNLKHPNHLREAVLSRRKVLL